jgi:hypothetical protein
MKSINAVFPRFVPLALIAAALVAAGGKWG